MARTPVHRLERTPSAFGGSLVVLMAAAALLVAGTGVAGASTQTPGGPFIVMPEAGISSSVRCGTVAEFTALPGIQFQVAETGSIQLLGTFLSWPSIPTPPCGSEVVVAE